MSENQGTYVTNEAKFRATPIAWTVKEFDSGSVSVVFIFAIQQQWHEKEEAWSTPWPAGYISQGQSWIVKSRVEGQAKSAMNEQAIANLSECGLWNGDFEAFTGAPPQVTVIIDVQEETYNGKTFHRAAWIEPNADKPKERPGGFQPASADLLSSLRSRFQGATRAIAGPPPSGAVTPPPGVVQAPLAAPVTPAVAQPQPPAYPPQQSQPPAQHSPSAQPQPQQPPQQGGSISQPIQPQRLPAPAPGPQIPPAGPPSAPAPPAPPQASGPAPDPQLGLSVQGGGDLEDPIDPSGVPF